MREKHVSRKEMSRAVIKTRKMLAWVSPAAKIV
jgi:hypothetical protein